MKLLSTSLLNHEQAVCPHCETKIGLRQISEYFLKGTNYSIQCPHCKKSITSEAGTHKILLLRLCRIYKYRYPFLAIHLVC